MIDKIKQIVTENYHKTVLKEEAESDIFEKCDNIIDNIRKQLVKLKGEMSTIEGQAAQSKIQEIVTMYNKLTAMTPCVVNLQSEMNNTVTKKDIQRPNLKDVKEDILLKKGADRDATATAEKLAQNTGKNIQITEQKKKNPKVIKEIKITSLKQFRDMLK